MSPQLQAQDSIKMTYKEIPALLPLLLLLPFPHLAELVTPLPSRKLSYLTPSMCSDWIFPFGAQKPRSSDHRLITSTIKNRMVTSE
jgi:hypothetical protein